MENKKISIQLLRVIACLGVFIVHFGQRLNFSGVLFTITDFGKYGVQLFFIISGFLICNSLKPNTENAINKHNVFNFYKKKLIRLLPLYFFCIAWFAFSENVIYKNIPSDPYGLGWLRYVFLLNGIVANDGTYFWSNLGITWTIPVFLIAYLVSPLILKFVKNFKWCTIATLISIVVSILLNLFAKGYLSAFTYLPYFLLGFLIYFAKDLKQINFKQNLLLLANFTLFVVSVLLIIICKLQHGYFNFSTYVPHFLLCIFAILTLKKLSCNLNYIALYLLLIAFIIVNYFVKLDFILTMQYSIIFAIIFYALLQMETANSNSKFFNNVWLKKVVSTVDTYSYTIYLVHGIVFCSVLDKFVLSRLIEAVIGIFGTAILTILVYHFYEKPITKLFKKITKC